MAKKDAFINLLTSKDGTNSSISPSAQSSGLLRTNNAECLLSDAAMEFILHNSTYPIDFKYLVYLLLVSGCRISEALKVNSNDITGSYRVHLRGSKGSNDRIIFLPPLPFGTLNVGSGNYPIWQVYSRFYVYRVLKQHGIYLSKEGNQNKAVTHAFRNAYAAELQTIVGSSELKSQAMGHKSLKSKKYYEQKLFK